MIIFWDEYLLRATTISSSYYASIIEQLRYAMLEKCRSKVSDQVLLLHDNASVHKCNIVQAAIQKAN